MILQANLLELLSGSKSSNFKKFKVFYSSKKFLNEMPDIIKLSRSTVEKYLSCPRCCVLDKKYQIKPPSLPFTLNIAVDNLCLSLIHI